MQFDEYQDRTAETAIYPGFDTGNITAIAYLGLGLGEAGEIQGKIKKILRDSNGVIEDQHRIAIAKELGDLQWYVARLAAELGISLNRVAEGNLRKLDDRKHAGTLQGSGDDR